MSAVQLFASLRNLAKPGKQERWGVRVQAPELVVDPEAIGKELAAEMAAAIQEQCRANLESGRGLDGRPLPGINSGTQDWREREAAQGARGGKADERYTDSKFRSRAERNYSRDYRSRMGAFTPRSGGPRGVVSGLLAASFLVKPARKGGWIVFVAGRRSKARPGEQLSALESVLGIRPGQTVPINLNSPKIRDAVKRVAKNTFVKDMRKLFKSASRLASIINRAGRAVGFDDND